MRGRRQAYPNLGHGSNRLEGAVETARRRVFRAVEPGRPQSLIDPSTAHLFPLGAPVVGGRRTRFRVALLF